MSINCGGPSMGGKTVLIVDDSEFIRDLLHQFLERCGCNVCGFAKSGREGVEMYKFLNPDVVFMDINMPVMNGLDAIKTIKQEYPNAKVVIMSSVGDNDIVEQVKEIGGAAFIKKPVSIHKIITALSLIG